MNRTSVISLGLALALAGGCVKKSTYEALQAKSAATEADLNGQLDTAHAKSASLEEALAAEQKKSAALTAQIADLENSLKQAQEKHAATLKDKAKLASSVEEMKEALKALEQQRKLTEARVAEYRNMLDRFKEMIDAGKLSVKIVDGRMVVELPSDILFASGSVDISKEGKEAIAETATILADMGDKKFQVAGHTDDQPIKTARFPNNWALAAGRAIAVLEVMVEAGMPRESLSAAGYADVVPAASNDTKEGRAQNRRIEIAMVPDFSVLPGFDELQKIGAK